MGSRTFIYEARSDNLNKLPKHLCNSSVNVFIWWFQSGILPMEGTMFLKREAFEAEK